MRLQHLFALLMILASSLTHADAAQEDGVQPPNAQDSAIAAATVPRWEWGLGFAAAYLRDYPGSSHNDAYALPLPWFIWRSDRVEVGREGGRGILYRTPQQELDFTLTANPPAGNDDNPERAGMQSLHAVVEPGLRMRWRFPLGDSGRWRLGLSLPVRYALAVDGRLRTFALGARVEPGASIDGTLMPGWTWGMSASAGFTESDYADYYYGVDAVDVTPARPLYGAPGGYAGWSANTRLMFRRDRLTTGVFIRYENIADATFADSPLVTTNHGFTVGYMLSWRIGQSRELIARNVP